MKKKLLSIFFVFLISVLSFSAKVNDVKFSANKFIINLNAADGECLVSADEESRLIYIEKYNTINLLMQIILLIFLYLKKFF